MRTKALPRTLLLSAASSAALLLQAPAVPAQDSAGVLAGGVFLAEDRAPLADVRIRIQDEELSAVSDSAGEFRIDGVPPGRHVLTLSYLNMFSDVAGSVEVEVGPSEAVWIDILLEIRVVPVPELVVEIERAPNRGKMVGFEQRRATAFGTFIDREDIDRAQPDRLTQLFYAVPGVRVVPAPDGGLFGARLASARGGFECFMEVFLDGIRQPSGTFDLDIFPPQDVEAIEVYSGSSRTPAIFAYRGAMCGAVVIWTRDPTRQER